MLFHLALTFFLMPHILFTGHLFYFLFLKPVLSPKASVTSFISNMLICLLKQYSKCKMKLTARVQLYFFIWLGTKNLKARETAQIPPPPLSPRSSCPQSRHKSKKKHNHAQRQSKTWLRECATASLKAGTISSICRH